MNFCIVNHYALSPKSAGGTRHFDLAVKLTEFGHTVTIIASSYNHWTREEEHPASSAMGYVVETIQGVGIVWLHTPPYRGNIGRLLNMIAFSRLVHKGRFAFDIPCPDVVIGSSPHLFGALAAQRLARRLQCPFILEIRDLWPQTLLDLGALSPCHPLVCVLGLTETYLYRNSDRIISLLPGAVEHIVQKGGREEKITWLPNGVDLEKIPRPEWGRFVDGGRPVDIVYAGSHGTANALEIVLDAVFWLQKQGKEREFRFTFYGRGPEKGNLMNRANLLGLTNVKFRDALSKSEIYRVLEQADAFVVSLADSPLYNYGISLNKIYDYLALGRPVFFAGRSCNNPVQEAGAGFVVPPEDPEALGNAFLSFLELTLDERRQMGQGGRSYVERGHAMTFLAETLSRVCEKVIEEC